MKYKKALVTGGAGFIGSHLTNELIKLGLEVVVLDDLSIGSKANLSGNVKFILGDIRDKTKVAKIIHDEDIEIIFHLAAKVTIRGSENQYLEDSDVNINGTLSILNALQLSKVKKFIFASSMAVYANSELPKQISETYLVDPISPYGISKLACEHYSRVICDINNIDCIILRYFNTYGPRQTFTPYVGVLTIFINNLLENKTLTIYGDGSQQRDFVHVKDIVQGNIKAMISDITYGLFNIGTGIGTSVNDLYVILNKVLSSKSKVKYTSNLKVEIQNSIANINEATKHLDYSPVYKKIYIEDVINYWSTKI